ncbi:MAG: hypothetical protein IEMM0002_0383 [bacterium]|nr:MAG: hypothetical protein IEMM0002_0383 [bacterium]
MFVKVATKWILTAAFFILLTTAGVGKAYAFEVGAEVDYWMTALSGDVKSDSGSVTGTTLDFKDSLGLDDYNSAGGKLHVELGDHLLTLGYTPLAYSGIKTISSDFIFNGQTYTAGAVLESKLRLNMTDIQYTYWLMNLSLGAFTKIGLTGGIKNFDFVTSLNETTTGIVEEKSAAIPIPVAGARIEVGVGDFVKLAASGVGMGYGGNSIFDVTGSIEVSPLPFVGATLGYRTVSVTLNANDTNLNAGFSGLFIGLFAHF